MQRVSNATFRFYDVTPVGRLMNRLTSDMGTVDGQIAGQLMSVAWYSLGWLSSMAVISSATPSFLVISIIMTAIFVIVFDRFLPTSQSLRRLETIYLSPLMSNVGTLLEGLTTVRAFRAEPHFQNRIVASTDSFQKMDHFYWCLQAWLQYRFDLLSALSTFALTLTAILSGLSSGTIGFVLASASNFVQSTHNLCRRYGEMQMQFVSVERVVELLSLEQEPAGTVTPSAAWPLYGDDIVFDNVTIRYAPEFDAVLSNVSFTIPGGANVAVTGRTGSGKSTLALSLLGTLHPDAHTGGSISIGGVDLATVDKHILRRNLTFVAQDPVLFPGTLRDNLDPLDERDEGERADVLRRVLGGTGAFTLDTRVDGGGKNLSQGQRQLVGLGRAMLRRSPVVIMDEATASIDGGTAAYIQRLLREELRHSTVSTIAHKAEAVEDADFEVVLDQGRVARAGPRGARLQGLVSE
jgi:ABC-type multidrug transport system fused ATPase/permease subunit